MALHTLMRHAPAEKNDLEDNLDAELQEFLSWTVDPQPSPEVSLASMSNAELADRCMREIELFRCGEPSNDQYGVELFRRALGQLDSTAWEVVQQRFARMFQSWLCTHPMRHAASYFDSDENYVALAFARFWQATAGNSKIHFTTLASILRYLRASLSGAILDTLRTYSRPKEVALPEPGCDEELYVEEVEDDLEIWETIYTIIPDGHQQRLAYLLFYCHLKPREILRFCPGEFSSVTQIYRMKRNISDRLLRSADYLRWRLSSEPREFRELHVPIQQEDVM